MVFLDFAITTGAGDEICPVVQAHLEHEGRGDSAGVNTDANVKGTGKVVQVSYQSKTGKGCNDSVVKKKLHHLSIVLVSFW